MHAGIKSKRQAERMADKGIEKYPESKDAAKLVGLTWNLYNKNKKHGKGKGKR